MRRVMIVVGMTLIGCGEKPQPKMCSSEAPPAKPDQPLVIGICPMSQGAFDAGNDALPSDATNDAPSDAASDVIKATP